MDGESVYAEPGVRLNEPTAEAVGDAFAALPRRGSLACVCRWERRLEVLAALEAGGAFAIRLEPCDGFAAARITALKGKSGPCYDTGRRAVYRGAAAAVLDDDRHLIVGEIRVCEKTGGIYALEPYRGAIAVTAADPALLARLEADPVPFDCNTFDADSQRLAQGLERVNALHSASSAAVVYPGPFRALVLPDGTVVRRGLASLVPEAEAERNGLLQLPPECEGEARPCECYEAACRARGAAFILEPLTAVGGPGENVSPVQDDGGRCPAAARLDARALAALRAAPRDFKRRLLQLIEAREPYLVLTGSDPDVAGGCCPSTQVGVANRLVAARALQAYAPPAPPDACTATFYAFHGEIGARGDGSPEFCLCEPVRAQAAAALRDERGEGLKRALRVGLLAVLGASLGLSAWRALEPEAFQRGMRLCAACEAAAKASHRMAEKEGSGVAKAVALGAVAAVQPCALALFAGALAAAWKGGAGAGTNAVRGGAVAAGAALSNAALAVALAWGFARVSGGLAERLQAVRGPLMVLAGLPLTGLFRMPARRSVGAARFGGLCGLFLLGAAAGVLWCPAGAGLFAGALLPAALRDGTAARDALCYGAGYALPLFVVCAVWAAGMRLERLRSFGRCVSAAAGFGLVTAGTVSALAGF